MNGALAGAPDADAPRPPKWLFPALGLSAIALGAVLLAILKSIAPVKPLPSYGAMPRFSLVDQSGAAFTDGALAGKVWIADFIFTRCQASCPLLTAQMKKLAADLAGERRAHLVSISVDPENDTPAVLADYAAKVPADPALWTFATGAADEVKRTVVSGFKMSVERTEKGAGEADILHGNWFVLGDPQGTIRGFYHVDSDEELAVLEADAKRLLRDAK